MAQKLVMPFYPYEQPAWNMRGNDPNDWTTQRFTGLAKHEGKDFGVALETPYHAAGVGVVVDLQIGWIGGGGGGWGTHYVIRYDDVILPNGQRFPSLFVRYAHMSAHYLNIGDTVVFGQVFGTSGNTGSSTGPHLHIETRTNFVRGGYRGDLLDPADVFWWPIPDDHSASVPPNQTPDTSEKVLNMAEMTRTDLKELLVEVQNETTAPWEQDTRKRFGHTIIQHDNALYFIGEGADGRPVCYHIPDEHMFWFLCDVRFLSTGPIYEPGKNPIATAETNAGCLDAFARMHKVEFDLRQV